MIIDIIDYTGVLSVKRLEKIRAAQAKKNALTAKLEEDTQKLKRDLIDNNTFSSSVYQVGLAELTAAYEAKVEAVRDDLLFYLNYVAKEDGEGDMASGTAPPYSVDYSLSIEERVTIVKEYYESNYQDDVERFDAFSKDSFAEVYLGDFYLSVWHYFKNLAEA